MPRRISPAVWTALLLVCLALAARLIPGPRTIDDAYITYRYARNLLAGEGFTYNPGERVQGTTTPLYTLLMAGLGAISGGGAADFPVIAWLVNAAADALTCLLLWRIGRRLGAEWPGLAAGLLWALAPYSVTFAIGGLETSLYVLLLTAAVWAHLTRRAPLAALCAALALLTRPDALLLAAPLALDRLLQARRGRRLSALEFACLLLPLFAWYGFAWAYFGSPIPHSVQAKLVTYRLGPGAALIRLLQHYATPFLEQNVYGIPAIAVGLVLYPFLALAGARRLWRAERSAWPWLVYPWLYLAAFAIPNPLIFRWYLTPPLPAYFFMILCGAEELLRALFSGGKPAAGWRRWLPAALILLLPLASQMSEWRWRLDHGPQRPAPEMAFIKLELLYRQAAEITAANMTPETVLAAGDVGVLGYYTPARILDTVGLNSPLSLNYYPLDPALYAINYAVPPRLILDQQPDYLILLEVYGRLGLLRDPQFQQTYTLLETLPTDIYGSNGLLIYRRGPR